MKKDRLERLLKLILLLESGRHLAVRDLAAAVKATRRTVFRDLEFLRQRLGASIAYDKNSRCYQIAVDQKPLPRLTSTGVSPSEVMMTLMMTRILSDSAFFPNPQAAESAALKLETVLPQELRDCCRRSLAHVHVKHDPFSDNDSITELFSKLLNAITNRKVVRVRYDGQDQNHIETSLMHPYELIHIHGGWHVVGWLEKWERMQVIKLERIIEFKTANVTFRRDLRFNLEEEFNSTWDLRLDEPPQPVQIRFFPPAAGEVDEYRWHRTQKTTWQPDGTLLFEARVRGLQEIAHWVLGYGSRAQVLKPKQLQDLIRKEAVQTAARYGTLDGQIRKKQTAKIRRPGERCQDPVTKGRAQAAV
jgi:predicted DNA-binding transcriptional regulator YafY